MVANAAKWVLKSRKIFTFAHNDEVVDGAVVVVDGKVSSLVRNPSDLPKGVPIVDVGSQPVLPAFVDPHIHLEASAVALTYAVDCHTPPCDSIDEMLSQLVDGAELRETRGGWLIGQGGLFADRRFSDRRMPNRHDLDKVSTKFPIAVRLGTHVTVLNSLGLEMAMSNGLPNDKNSYVRLGEDGQPTGALHELFQALPIPALTDEQRVESIRRTTNELLVQNGVTCIGEISQTLTGLTDLADLVSSGKVPVKVEAFLWAPGTVPLATAFGDLQSAGVPSNGSGFNVRGIKLFVDGGISAAGAALLRPYLQKREGKLNFGRLTYSEDELVEIVRLADGRGLQIAAHVNGERAQRLLCDAIVRARTDSDSSQGHPVRLEHAGNMLTERETFDYWAKANAIPMPNAPGIYNIGSFVPDYTGDYMRKGFRPFRRLLDAGWDVSSSSDASGSDNLNFNPFHGIQAAVTRRTCTDEILDADQAVSVMEGLRMHTAAAAKGIGLDADRGSIEGGKVADLIVLDRDPRDVHSDKISQTRVVQVFVDGRLVMDRV